MNFFHRGLLECCAETGSRRAWNGSAGPKDEACILQPGYGFAGLGDMPDPDVCSVCLRRMPVCGHRRPPE